MIDDYWRELIRIANEDGNVTRAFERAQEFRAATFEHPYSPSVRAGFASLLRRHARRMGLALDLRQGRPVL